MKSSRDQIYWQGLVRELCKLPDETSWLEFKHNNAEPKTIGEYLSALSNAAALDGRANAYMIWGVKDDNHAIIGTSFDPRKIKIGNEELENWLLRLLSPRLHFRFISSTINNLPIIILEIPAANGKPTQFENKEWTRIGSYKKPLKDYPELERQLWRYFDNTPFELQIATGNLSGVEALALLDYPAYFDLFELPLPADRDALLDRMKSDRLLVLDQSKNWGITNLGALLFAKDLRRFRSLARKTIRVVVYEGTGRTLTLREHEGCKGYASGFTELIERIHTLVPRNETIGQALRHENSTYPSLAIRELVANALIHQDLSITGTSPMIEIFLDRLEITNPGTPLVLTDRFLDSPPRSRNEQLASFMRRLGICEERGSGVDKVVAQTETYQLPAPIFETPEGFTRVVLFAHKDWKNMDSRDRTRACYLHACLRYVQREPMTNASLRERFGILPENSSMVTRVLKESLADGLIKPFDNDQGRKHAKYLPFWA